LGKNCGVRWTIGGGEDKGSGRHGVQHTGGSSYDPRSSGLYHMGKLVPGARTIRTLIGGGDQTVGDTHINSERR
jgi:hypothetical protein